MNVNIFPNHVLFSHCSRNLAATFYFSRFFLLLLTSFFILLNLNLYSWNETCDKWSQGELWFYKNLTIKMFRGEHSNWIDVHLTHKSGLKNVVTVFVLNLSFREADLKESFASTYPTIIRYFRQCKSPNNLFVRVRKWRDWYKKIIEKFVFPKQFHYTFLNSLSSSVSCV